MKSRMVVPVIVLVITLFSAGLIAAAPAQISAVQAAVLTAPPGTTSAVTHTVRLPLISSCYPYLDPDFSYQYDMSIIHADDAWALCSLNAGSVTIAVIDTGVDLDHPDLKANLLPGYDFWDYDTVPEDGNGHGTNVAGIAAAALNGLGVAGVAPTAKILPVRVLNSDGSGYLSDIVDGIIYAADRAKVLNLSLGGPDSTQVLQNAINYAVGKGRLVIAAAGNCGSNYYYPQCNYTQNQPLYPAAYGNVMAVAATTASDTRAIFSNMGSYVDIAAPGEDIYNAYFGGLYFYESGTSQAAPHVAGLAALVWAKNPAYTAAQVWSRITSTAVDLGTTGVDATFGAGRIDVRQALGLTALQATTPQVTLDKAQTSVVDQRYAPIAPGRIIVKFKDATPSKTSARVLTSLPHAALKSIIPAIEVQVWSVPVGAEWDFVDRLRSQPEVEYAEPDYVLHLIR